MKSHLSYGRVAGDDKLTTEYFRNYRNLDFYSDIYEFNLNFEGAFQQEQVGHRYRLRKVKGMKGYEIYTYAFVGAGVFQLCVPVGIGFKYTLDRSWGVGLELGIRKTFTDYIDDVSTTYFDFSNYSGTNPLSAQLSDRSNHSVQFITDPGAQRGDPRENDSYMFAIFSLNYKLTNGRGNLPRF